MSELPASTALPGGADGSHRADLAAPSKAQAPAAPANLMLDAEVSEQVNASGGDFEEAARLLAVSALGNADLFRQLMEPGLARACRAAVADWRSRNLSSVQAHYRRPRDEDDTSVDPHVEVAMAMASARRLLAVTGPLLEMMLPNGIRLRDANQTECINAANAFERLAAEYAARARFLREVGKRAGAKRVGDALSEATLAQLFRKMKVM